MGKRTQLFSQTPPSFSDRQRLQRRDAGTGCVAPQGTLFKVTEKAGIFDFEGQVHLVTVAHHRGLVFVFGARRGVRRGEGQRSGQAIRGRGVDAKHVYQFKEIGDPERVRRRGGIGLSWRGACPAGQFNHSTFHASLLSRGGPDQENEK